MCWVWPGAAELYLPEYLDTAATPVGVTSGRHKNQSREMKSGTFHRLNDSSISSAAPVLTWRTHCRVSVCAWFSLSSVLLFIVDFHESTMSYLLSSLYLWTMGLLLVL